jgi:hypothetical protein
MNFILRQPCNWANLKVIFSLFPGAQHVIYVVNVIYINAVFIINMGVGSLNLRNGISLKKSRFFSLANGRGPIGLYGEHYIMLFFQFIGGITAQINKKQFFGRLMGLFL